MSAITLVSVGGLLPRDLLDRVTSGDQTVPGTGPTDYGLAPGERLNDAITRSWNRLRGVWASFRRAEALLPPSEQTATSVTRERWLRPLFDELGFAGLPLARGLHVDGKDYPISHHWGSTVPIHLPGARVAIDRASRGVRGAARSSPHGLVQEYLNRSESCLWGIVSNGLVLRILRDNASLTRQAYVEFDLEAMFDGEAYSDFVLLWLTCHRTRFDGEPPEKCLLEQWSAEAASAGTRALDKLREGVEQAIVALGEGFVAHRDNGKLRQALRSGEVSTEELQRQLLRVVYRLLFLLVAESRDLLLDPEASETAKIRYHRFYSVQRIRALAARRRGTPHDDLWASLTVTMDALAATGAPAIGLKPLGSFLWSPEAIAALAGASLDNHHLLTAVRHLCLVYDKDAKVPRAVDYRNLGAEELGSVYESLLELHAQVDVDARTFTLATAAGNERKTTGSYYTPDSLIRVLLDSAL
ncbi:MAG: type II DNA modification enzyme, partial [Acidimicrobiia bacterium]|nr:type II DNA modification enzyme [Acidimicrobiia bacterium]